MSDFACIVVAHNSATELERLLGSIERCFDPLPQVIVADSGSTDGSLAVAGAHDAETVDLPSNPGFGAANNAALELADAEVSVLLNPDIELFDDRLLDLVEIARHRDVLLAPRLVNEDGSTQRSAHPLPGRISNLLPAVLPPLLLPPSLRNHFEPWRSHKPLTVGWTVAACLVANTALLGRLGPFDPTAFLFYEDLELCLRARANGIPTEYHPEVSVTHAGSHSTGKAFGAEPFELLASRRREVILQQLGPRALKHDDHAQLLTFSTRLAAKRLLRRDTTRECSQLQALRETKRATTDWHT